RSRMPAAEHRAEELRDATFVGVLEELELAGVEPDALAVSAPIDLHVMVLHFLQVTPASRALHEMGFARALGTGLVQLCASVLDQLRVELREVLLFITTWFFFRRHLRNGWLECRNVGG